MFFYAGYNIIYLHSETFRRTPEGWMSVRLSGNRHEYVKGKGIGATWQSDIKYFIRLLHLYSLVTGPVHSCAISTPGRAYSPAAISAHWTYHTHCHLCPTRYSFSPESSEAFEGWVPCPTTQRRNNVPIMRREKHAMSLKILHQAWFETTQQAATLTRLRLLCHSPVGHS